MKSLSWLLYSFMSLFSLVANYLLAKGLSANFSPFLSITVTGGFQLIVGSIIVFFSNEKLAEFSRGNIIMSCLITFCVFGIDYGLMAAYKDGGNSVIITLIVSMATVVMLPIGYIFFKERLSIIQLAGVALSVVSLLMVILFPAKD